ncbi:MAG: hypothetical protein ACR2FQ_01525 [Pseudonocardiaceae bacterium]
MTHRGDRSHPLDAVLTDRGLSLAGLAELFRAAVTARGFRSGADRNLTWKWKTGRRVPTEESQWYLADALGVPRQLVIDLGWPEWLRHAVAGSPSVLDVPWSPAGTARVLRDIAGGRMDRRGFMIVTGGALSGVAASWAGALEGASSSPAAPDAAGDPGRLSAATVDRVGHRLAELRHLDDALGGARLHQLAVAEFSWLTQLVETAGYETPTGRRLVGLITEAARPCGWLHFDASLHAAAQSYYIAGLRCSATAQDPLAGAHILACMSLQATWTGHHQDAVTLIESAQERLGGDATPRLRALLASRKALAHARAGEAAACGRALNSAERLLDAVSPGTWEPDWIYYFDEAELAGHAGACWIALRQPARARPLLDTTLRTTDPSFVRDRAIQHTWSAEAHLQDGELDLACEELGAAVDLAHRTASARAIATIRQTRQAMSRYDRETRVRELDRRLATFAA